MWLGDDDREQREEESRRPAYRVETVPTTPKTSSRNGIREYENTVGRRAEDTPAR